MALASESKETEVVSIPGIRGQGPKEITVRNLASIIQARVEEIIDLVHYQIVNSGYKQRLIAGIVVTGGGAELKHITQLFEYLTGMDARIGYPTEHLASNNNLEELASPMYSTGIGLVLKGFEALDRQQDYSGVADAGNVRGHSGVDRSPFYKKLLNQAGSLFKDDEINDKQ